MNIHKSQLFWCELQGYKVLTHCHIFTYYLPTTIYLPIIYLSFYHIYLSYFIICRSCPSILFVSRGHGHLGRALRGDLLGRPPVGEMLLGRAFPGTLRGGDDGFLCFYVSTMFYGYLWVYSRFFWGRSIGKIECVDIFLVGRWFGFCWGWLGCSIVSEERTTPWTARRRYGHQTW